MNRQTVWFYLPHIRGVILASVLTALVGCSSGLSTIQTWESTADRPESPALLASPSSIKVREVNARRMSSFIMDDLALEYELVPGRNEVVFTYKTIWAKNTVVDNGESKVHVVETPRQVFRFDAQPGATYRFDVEKPDRRAGAEALSENFTARLLDSESKVVAESSLWVAKEDQPRSPVPSQTENRTTGEAATNLERLKSIWAETSEEEKREFLRWAFE